MPILSLIVVLLPFITVPDLDLRILTELDGSINLHSRSILVRYPLFSSTLNAASFSILQHHT